MKVGDRIKELRAIKGLTVNKLANLAGISQSYLRDIELGNKQPTVEYLSYICEALDISLETFFKETTSENKLVTEICKLNAKQQEALLSFLKTL